MCDDRACSLPDQFGHLLFGSEEAVAVTPFLWSCFIVPKLHFVSICLVYLVCSFSRAILRLVPLERQVYRIL